MVRCSVESELALTGQIARVPAGGLLVYGLEGSCASHHDGLHFYTLRSHRIACERLHGWLAQSLCADGLPKCLSFLGIMSMSSLKPLICHAKGTKRMAEKPSRRCCTQGNRPEICRSHGRDGSEPAIAVARRRHRLDALSWF